MNGLSADRDAAGLRALSGIVAVLSGHLGGAGWDHVDPGQILDAENLLDLYGEDVRARAFVFDGTGSGDLCLRPDLTLSICRHHLIRSPQAAEGRYLANGPVFRRPVEGDGEARAAQFTQIGVECFGGDDPVRIEADIFTRTQTALTEVGCKGFAVATGDLGILFSMIDAAPIPDRWRARLKRHVWRPARFRTLLHDLAASGSDDPGRLAFLKALGNLAPEQAQAAVSHMLSLSETSHVGLRTHEEISARFLEQAEDARSHPLSDEIVSAIETAAALKAPCDKALVALRDLAAATGLAITPALERMECRMGVLEGLGVDAASLPFDGDFGRNLEYYDGFVFEFYDPTLATTQGRRAAQLAGGGRYDAMLPAAARAFGTASPAAKTAFGAAIRPETVLEVIG